MLHVCFEAIMYGLFVTWVSIILHFILLDDLESLGARILIGALFWWHRLCILVLVRHRLFLELETLFVTCVDWKCLHCCKIILKLKLI